MTPPTTSVQRIEPTEWALYRDTRLRALQDSPDAFGSSLALEAARPDQFWMDRIAAATSSANDLPLFGTSGDQVGGLLWCKAFPEEPGVAHLFQMWVAPEFRRLGLGAKLLQAAIDWARSAHIRQLRLGVAAGDNPAVRLYLRHGFVQVGGLEPLRDGSPLQAQTMQLVLGAA